MVILMMIPAFSGVRIICGDHGHTNGHNDQDHHDDQDHDDNEDLNEKSVPKENQ